MPMAIVDTGNYLLKEFSGLRLVQFSLFYNIIEKLSSRYKLHNHENIGRSGNNLIELDDVRMTKEFKILNLSTYFSDHIETFNFLPVEDLDGYFVLR